MAKSNRQYDPAERYNRAIADHILEVQLTASSVDSWVFVADQDYQVVSITEIHSVVGGASAAVRPRKVTDTSAPGASASATVVELSAAADLTASINTTRSLTLATSISDLRLTTGNEIGLDFSGTLTGLVGVLCIALRRI